MHNIVLVTDVFLINSRNTHMPQASDTVSIRCSLYVFSRCRRFANSLSEG